MWGILSVIVDRDVIDYPDAGALLGPAMALAACIVTFSAVIRTGGRPWARVVMAAVVTFTAMLLVGAIGYSFTRSDVLWMPAATVHFAIAPFVPAAAALSSAVVAAANALAGYTDRRSSEGGII